MKKVLFATASALLLMFSALSSVCADSQTQEISPEKQEIYDYYENLLSSALDLSVYEPQSDSLKADFHASEPILDVEIIGDGSAENKMLSIGMTYDEVLSVLGNDYVPDTGFEDQVVKPGLLLKGDFKSADGKKLTLSFGNKVREECQVKDSFLCSIGNDDSPVSAADIKTGSITTGSTLSDVVKAYGSPAAITIKEKTERSDGTQKKVYYLKLKYSWKADKQIGEFSFTLDHDKVVCMGIGASINED